MNFHGLGASEGAAVGAAYLYRPFMPVPDETPIPPEARTAQVRLLDTARQAAIGELDHVISQLKEQGAAECQIFQAHKDLLEDEDIWEEILDEMSAGASGSFAAHQIYTQYADLMRANSDPMMQERAADLLDVRNRLLRNLAGEPEQNLSMLPGPVVIVAHDLLPADTATMDRRHVLAIVTEAGGQTSHTAILARSYEIPAVLGVSGLLSAIEHGQTIAVDGGCGQIVIDPEPDVCDDFSKRRRQWHARAAAQAQYRNVPCQTADGVRVEIGGNIGSVSQEAAELAASVDLIGLFRTEFLYMQSEQLPSEEQQFEAYRQLLQLYPGKPVILRTLDVGGDKALPCLDLPKEDNPFLGKRALRLCLDREALFEAQLRAAYRASAYGELWIMFPMVGTLEDWHRAKALAERVRRQLLARQVPMADHVRLGMMIEIPSAAIMAGQFAKEVDFASIGTNDLCQYTLAVDRNDPELCDYYQMYNPAVFRLIAHSISAFRQAGKPICVCGELGGDVNAAPALVGMGLRKLSMTGSSIAAVKHCLAQKTIPQLEALAQQALACSTAGELEACLKDAAY